MHSDAEINRMAFPKHKQHSEKAETKVGLRYGHSPKMSKESEPKVAEGKKISSKSDAKFHTHKKSMGDEPKKAAR